MKKLHLILLLCIFTIWQGCERDDLVSESTIENEVLDDIKQIGFQYKNELSKLNKIDFQNLEDFQREYENRVLTAEFKFSQQTQSILNSQVNNVEEVDKITLDLFASLETYLDNFPENSQLTEEELIDRLLVFIEEYKLASDVSSNALIVAKVRITMHVLTIVSQINFFESASGYFSKQKLNRGKCRGWKKIKWILKCTAFSGYAVFVQEL